jgi:hypothetical protein
MKNIFSYRLDQRSKAMLSLLTLPMLFLALFYGLARASPQGANDIFVNSGQVLGNYQSRDVALGDLDGDGDLDAFVPNGNGGDRVWKNNGSAIFTDSGQSLGSVNSRGMALGDVDGDDDLDAYVASPTNKLWINQGGDQGGVEGSFTDSGQSLGSTLSQDVALGDLDGDLDLDAFVANFSDPNKVWVNQGGSQGGTQGVFSDSGQNLNNLDSYGVALGDVDGDLDLDAVVANYVQGDVLFINQGRAQGGTQGVFANGQFFTGPNCYDVALGDLDGDGDLDVFFANYNQGNMVWWNEGGAQGGTEGVFSDSGQLLGDGPSRSVALADVDADSDLDAVVANYQASDEVWLNDGQGIFTLAQSLDNVLSYAVALADLDNNGTQDVFVATQIANYVWLGANHWTTVDPPGNTHTALLDTRLYGETEGGHDPGTVTTDSFVVHSSYLGRVAGHIPYQAKSAPVQPQWSRAWFYPDEVFFPGEPVEATLTDSILGPYGIPFAAYTWQFRTRVLGGSAIFSDTHQSLGNTLTNGVAVGDFDDDGDLDALAVNGNNQPDQVWVNAGGNQGGATGVFIAGVSLGDTTSNNVVMGDLDSDGYPDALILKDGPNPVMRNLGTANFGQLTTIGNANSRGAALGDLDSDGDLDAYVANYNANKVWRNLGSGHFTDSGQNLGLDNSIDVALGDLDGDGDLDAVVADYGVNHVWLNDGNGLFTGFPLGDAWTTSTGLALGDLNADGWLDAVFANYGTADEVWLNDGTGILTLTHSLGDTYSYAVALGDLDWDGDLDAYVANYNQPGKVWLNDGSGGFSDSGQALGLAYSKDVALGDLDGDGDLDAFVANFTQPNTVWFNRNNHRLYLPVVRRP